jgi:uncharacterized protein (DUF1800 family)
MPSTMTRYDAAHLLRRVGFGGLPAEIEALVGLTRDQAVDRVTDLSNALPVIRPAGIDHPPTQYGAWATCVGWWFDRMVKSPTPLQEKMVLFWHGHFATQGSKVGDMALMFDQNELFREHALGSFHDLCRGVATDAAMLTYLDNATNRSGNEQENFARELMELFTVGVAGFNEQDVIAMARAWTGHNQVEWTSAGYDSSYKYWPERHDSSFKTLFGIARPWDGPEAIDEIVFGSRQRECARFITTKLFRYFVHDNPSTVVIDELAATFISSAMNIGALVRAILLHTEFWSPVARYGLVKNPTHFVVDTLRRTGLPLSDAGITWSMQSMGQQLFEPPDVSGWGRNAYWLSTAGLWGRGAWLTYIRWGTAPKGFFSELHGMARADAAQRIFDALGIIEPLPSSRTRLESWFEATKARYDWILPANALLVGAMTPDYQVV